MLAIFMFDNVALNSFLNEDPVIVVSLIVLPAIIHGTSTYIIINYFDNTFAYFLIKYLSVVNKTLLNI